MSLKVSDNAATTLAASITSSPAITSITLVDASKFPVINHGGSGTDWSYVTLYDSANNLEIVKLTRRDNASNVLTIVRGTAAGITGVTDAGCRAWASTSTGVAVRLIAQTINDIAANALSAAESASAAAASVAPINAITGIVKGNGAGGFTSAVPATDYAPATAGTALLKGNGAGGFTSAAANTDYTNFAAGTRLVFAQAAAPTGWTQDVSATADNRMLRTVITAGGGTGGTHSPILNNVVPAHTHGFTTGTVSSDHYHTVTTGTESSDHAHGASDAGHSHTVNGSLFGWYGTQPGANSLLEGGVATSTGYASISVGGRTAAHTHSGTTSGISANHTHSGSTDNGSSQTNWAPKYIDLIICTKN